MYAIYADGVPLWAPTLSGHDIMEPVLEMELNEFGSLSFTLPPEHPLYDKLVRLRTEITVERDGAQLWRGRVLEQKTDFRRRRECTCEGELAYLVDSIQPPFEYRGSLKGYLEQLLKVHNDAVDPWKRFHLGRRTVVDSNDYIYRYKETYNSTWEVMQDQLLEPLGGYLVPRTEGGVHYLDYLSEMPASGQTIRFGENLLDLEELSSSEDVFTVLIPLGAQPEEGKTEADRITIASVNGGLNYLVNEKAAALYGRIWKTMVYDDVTTPRALLSKGREELNSGALSTSTIKVDAVDLALTGQAEPLELGTMVRIISQPHGIDTQLSLSGMTIPLQAPGEESYVLGKTMKTLTESALAAVKNGGK